MSDTQDEVRRRVVPGSVDPIPEKSLKLALNEGRRIKLAAAKEILGEPQVQKVAAEVFRRALAGLPGRALPHYLLKTLDIASCTRVGANLIRLELKNGRVFFGERSEQKQYVLHQLFANSLPEIVDADAYKLALDAAARYTGLKKPWYWADGGTYIEGGCYTGIKAIRWAEFCTEPSRILAVEIGADNCDVLRMNIEANGLSDTIIPVHAGLWRESGEGVQKHSYTTRRFLETTDRWKGHMIHEEPVSLLTIDDLLDKFEVDLAQYVNIQVNGAEIEVAKGMAKSLDRMKIIGVAAYYSQDGVPNADRVRAYLEGLGCHTISQSEFGRLTFVTPKYRDEVMAKAPASEEIADDEEIDDV